ncbi:MAG: hypothetical protein ABI599_13100 [Flavobacteriales bacterium]
MSKPKTQGPAESTLSHVPIPLRVAVADAREPMWLGLADMVNDLPGFRADVLVHDSAEPLRACAAKRLPRGGPAHGHRCQHCDLAFEEHPGEVEASPHRCRRAPCGAERMGGMRPFEPLRTDALSAKSLKVKGE